MSMRLEERLEPVLRVQFQTGRQVELQQVLEARDRRAALQQHFLARGGRPLICFTMNIAGPVKNSLLIRQGFEQGLEALRQTLRAAGFPVAEECVLSEDTGNEAFLSVEAEPLALKRLTCGLEDRGMAGRLYDMDVLIRTEEEPSGIRKIGREEVGLPERGCLLCGRPTRECASRRIHSVEDLQKKTAELLSASLLEQAARETAEYAQRALLYELAVTPKPGLVDRANNGSHEDMDFYTFLSSCAALRPYLERCVLTGQETWDRPAPETFRRLRDPGKEAERQMLRATGGVNTHKGAIFTMGILAGAAGRLSVRMLKEGGVKSLSDRMLQECAAMTKGLTASDFAGVTSENAATAGQRFYALYGITGVRGQMEAGLPAVRDWGLPALRRHMAAGKGPDRAGAAALLSIIAHTDDTNLIHRSSRERQQECARQAQRLLEEAPDQCPRRPDLDMLDTAWIREHLSPGGSADLLAACWFLYFLETDEAGRKLQPERTGV